MQPLSDIVYPFFWLFCGLWVGVFGGWSIKRAAIRNIEDNNKLAKEVSRFTKGWAIAFLIPSTAFWVLQLISNAGHPFFVRWPEPFRWVAIGLLVLCWLALLYWTWRRKGAEAISRVMILGYPKYPVVLLSPIAWKIGSIAVVAGGCWALWDTLGAVGET